MQLKNDLWKSYVFKLNAHVRCQGNLIFANNYSTSKWSICL